MSQLTYAALIKDRDVMRQIINPTYFQADYPIDWDQTAIWRFE